MPHPFSREPSESFKMTDSFNVDLNDECFFYVDQNQKKNRNQDKAISSLAEELHDITYSYAFNTKFRQERKLALIQRQAQCSTFFNRGENAISPMLNNRKNDSEDAWVDKTNILYDDDQEHVSKSDYKNSNDFQLKESSYTKPNFMNSSGIQTDIISKFEGTMKNDNEVEEEEESECSYCSDFEEAEDSLSSIQSYNYSTISFHSSRDSTGGEYRESNRDDVMFSNTQQQFPDTNENKNNHKNSSANVKREIKDLSSDILNCNINENVEERQDQISIRRNSAESSYSIERGTRNTEKENKKIAEGKRMISSHMQSSNEMTKVMLPSYSLPVHPRKLQKHKDTIQEVIGVILQKLHVMSLDSTSLSTNLSKKVQDFQNFIKKLMPVMKVGSICTYEKEEEDSSTNPECYKSDRSLQKDHIASIAEEDKAKSKSYDPFSIDASSLREKIRQDAKITYHAVESGSEYDVNNEKEKIQKDKNGSHIYGGNNCKKKRRFVGMGTLSLSSSCKDILFVANFETPSAKSSVRHESRNIGETSNDKISSKVEVVKREVNLGINTSENISMSTVEASSGIVIQIPIEDIDMIKCLDKRTMKLSVYKGEKSM